MTDVTWLPAPRLSGYEISSDGRLRSLDRVVVDTAGRAQHRKGRVLKATISSYGYHILNVKVPGKSGRRGVNVSIHRLMCEAFHGAPKKGQVVRHLNGIRLDNRPDNLKWGTPAENSQDMLRHGTNVQLNKTHCSNSHEYNGENTYIDGEGHRHCRECDRQSKARRSENDRAAKNKKLRAELRRIIDIHARSQGSGGSKCDCQHLRGEHDWFINQSCEVPNCICERFSMEWLVLSRTA